MQLTVIQNPVFQLPVIGQGSFWFRAPRPVARCRPTYNLDYGFTALARTDGKHLEFALRRAIFVAAEAHNERRIATGGQALEDAT